MRALKAETAGPTAPWAIALVEVRAALAAGAGPSAALATVREGPLAGPATAARLGRPLVEIAAGVDTGDPRADLLVRALAVAEAAGSGGVGAVDQARRAAEEGDAVRRALRVRTTQARQTAVVLTAVPAALWLVFVVTDPRLLTFYGRPLGAATGAAALVLAVAGQWWARRLVGAAAKVAAFTDPLVPSAPARDVARACALGLPALIVGSFGTGSWLGVPLAAVGVAVGLRGSTQDRARREARREAATRAEAGGAAETVELVATALAAGAAPVSAVALVAPVAPPIARPTLQAAVRRLRGGWDPHEAFGGGGLAALGLALAASTRWGAPAHDALASLARELRAQRRSAAEEAAERTQVALVFPTTLLTLPAFVLAVVPPLVWTAFVR